MHRFKSLAAFGAVLATLATVVVSVPAFAAADQPTAPTAPTTTPITAETRQIHGTVKSIATDNTSFVVTTRRHGDVTVTLPAGGLKLPAGFAHHKHHKSHLVGSLKELAMGDMVVVQGRMAASSTSSAQAFEARRIHLVHHAKAHHVTGTFKSFTGPKLTITVNGQDMTFDTTNATIRPADTNLATLTGTPMVTVVTRDGTTALAVRVHTA